MKAEEYDAWYRTPRGRWVGDVEYALLSGMLGTRQGETLLDIGCGTGYSRGASPAMPVWLRWASTSTGMGGLCA